MPAILAETEPHSQWNRQGRVVSNARSENIGLAARSQKGRLSLLITPKNECLVEDEMPVYTAM